jgi:WD40 repeat protein
MVRQWVLRSVVGLSCLGAAACNMSGSGSAPAAGKGAAAGPVDVGNPLFKAEPPEKMPAATGIEEQIVVPNAVVRLDKKQTVPAQIDGYLEVIGSPLPAGMAFDPNDRDIVFDSRDTERKVPYRRLQEGDRVAAGQQVALFNDLEVLVQIEASQRMMKASDEAIAAAKEATKYVKQQLDQLVNLGGGAVSEAEKLNLRATHARYIENVIQSEREKVRAEGEEKRGWALHTKPRARSMVNGIVTKVMRSRGEFLKAGEPIMEVLAIDQQQVEGNLDAKDAWAVTPGMKVLVEPANPVGPDLRLGSIDHRLEVTGVAVSAHPGRPLVASASLDNTAAVWDLYPPADRQRSQLRLQHPVGVRSVACSGPRTAGNKHWIATGGDDGKVRLWDATNPEKIAADKPTKDFGEAHGSAVTGLAFSPDGRYLATSAGRDVWVWDVAAEKKLYALPGEHKDVVTTVRFTPQATLVTVARDRVVRVWKVGDKAADLERSIDHRKGNVDTLGLSSGGGRILFDQDDGRIDVVSLADGRPVGSIQNAAASARFATLAVFSADDSVVLTASAGGDAQGELQLWKAPQAGGRGSEWRRLVTPGRSSPTCAAFSPDGDKKFVVVGTQAGRVHVWSRQSNEELAKGVRTGKVTSVLRLDPKTVKVRVETDTQPGETVDLLQDRGTATIIIRPHDPAAAPKAAAPAAPGGVIQAVGRVEANPVVPAGGLVYPVVAPPAGPTATPKVNPPTGGLPVGLTPSGSLTAPQPKPQEKEKK